MRHRTGLPLIMQWTEHTNIAYLNISEVPAKLKRNHVTLKTAVRDAIHINRLLYGLRDQLIMSYSRGCGSTRR